MIIKSFRIFENSLVQDEIDRLLDKGIANLTPDEISFLKNPVFKLKKIEKPKEILKYYNIAEIFFRKVLFADVRNYDLNDDLDLFDILANEDEVYDVVNKIYYMYRVQIDPENNNDFKLLNIFKKIKV
jgi:hypothetical protein